MKNPDLTFVSLALIAIVLFLASAFAGHYLVAASAFIIAAVCLHWAAPQRVFVITKRGVTITGYRRR